MESFGARPGALDHAAGAGLWKFSGGEPPQTLRTIGGRSAAAGCLQAAGAAPLARAGGPGAADNTVNEGRAGHRRNLEPMHLRL